MRCSAFTPFGHLAFSSRPPHGERIYRDMVQQLGDGQNYSDAFDSLAMARVYANAMAFARALYTLERAGSQYRPDRMLELLPTAERELGIIPDQGDTIAERRGAVSAEMRISRGARRSNVEAVLRDVLGEHFVAYLTIDADDAALSTNAPEDAGVYVAPGTQRSAFRTIDPVLSTGSAVSIRYEAVVGERPTLMVGDRVVIDPGNYGRTEAVTVTATGDGSFEATFSHPHDRRVVVATGRHPNQATTKRHSLIVLSQEAVLSQRLRRKAHRVLRRLFRGVSTWTLTCVDPDMPALPFVSSTELLASGEPAPVVALSGNYMPLTGLRVEIIEQRSHAAPGGPLLEVRTSTDGGDNWTPSTKFPFNATWALQVPGTTDAFLSFPLREYDTDVSYQPELETGPVALLGPFRVEVGRIGFTTIGAVEAPL